MRGVARRDGRFIALLALAGLCASAVPGVAQHRHCPDCDIPFQWDDDEGVPPPAAPFPQGFALTVPIVPGARSSDRPARLDRYVDVAQDLGRCWSSGLSPDDARWRDLTLRVSFRRDGTVNGVPRVVHVSGAADDAAGRRGRGSVLAALSRCTPLPFSPSLGRAIAGQIFAIRFIQERTS